MGQTTCSRYGDVQMSAEKLIRELVEALGSIVADEQEYAVPKEQCKEFRRLPGLWRTHLMCVGCGITPDV